MSFVIVSTVTFILWMIIIFLLHYQISKRNFVLLILSVTMKNNEFKNETHLKPQLEKQMQCLVHLPFGVKGKARRGLFIIDFAVKQIKIL